MTRASPLRDAPAVDFDSPAVIEAAAPPEGALALWLAAWASRLGGRGLLYVPRSETRARRVARAARGFAPELEVLVVPPWDCLPYDRASPSRAVMGERVAAFCRLCEPPSEAGRLVLAPVDAILQRIPPRQVWRLARFDIETGAPLPLEELKVYLVRAGYRLDERVDEPGEAAIRGSVIDLFPADRQEPFRLDMENGGVAAIRRYDPYSQRSIDETPRLTLLPAAEVLLDAALVRDFFGAKAAVGAAGGLLDGPPSAPRRRPGLEHRLSRFYDALETLFDVLPEAPLVLDPDTEARRAAALEQIADAYERRLAQRPEEAMSGVERPQGAPAAPDRLYLDAADWERQVAGRSVLALTDPQNGSGIVDAEAGPRFVKAPDRLRAVAGDVKARADAGDRVVLAAEAEADRERLARSIERRLDVRVSRLDRWAEVAALPEGGVAALPLGLDRGFRLPGLTVIAAADVEGERMRLAQPLTRAMEETFGTDLRPGDVVVHLDHGIGVVRGLETLDTGGVMRDYLALEFAAGAKLLVPVEEMDRLWRYGAEGTDVSLDRLDGEGWARRRAEVEAQIAETARDLVDLARQREEATAPRLQASRALYRRFVARFPFAETADQAAAIDAVLEDLARGRPMQRLICGDVGFGKTEVALRAAAVAALAGKQVAVVAPTTVLVRQHLETFRQRFAGFDLRIERLSGSSAGKAQRAVKSGLADGSIDIVVGTHALASKTVRFKDLGLVVIDEEQRFGTRQKTQLKGFAQGLHVLTMTATPIPRTLQAALVGLQDLSVIATPPVRRQPVRTFLLPFDPVVLREALLRERSRGGQSFVVCPRIQDLEPMAARLAELAPDLDVAVAHGRMKAEALDDIMIGFANGVHDVLLATNIIEAGLDIPRANTILVWRADRFGLAQLHQLRGRVGRGRLRGVAYLLLEPGVRLAAATEQRLRTLEALDSHGAGFALSARDLDLRGAGSLMGVEQTGHVQLIGVELYQHLLLRAVDAARGRTLPAMEAPEIHLDAAGFVPADYVPEEEVRIGLYQRLSRLADEAQVAEFAAEIEDRFGPPPEPVRNLLMLARIRQHCRARGIAGIEAGPQAVAARFHDAGFGRGAASAAAEGAALQWRDGRLIYRKPTSSAAERLRAVEELLERLDEVLEPAVGSAAAD